MKIKQRFLCTYSEKYKESLILFSHTVIDPGTVVIHLPNTSFTNTAGRREKMLKYDTLALLMSPAVYTKYAQHRWFEKHNLNSTRWGKGECHNVY